MGEKMNKRKAGSMYEDAACRFLEKNEVKIISRNFRSRFGEIDIVGLKEGILIFFEVKYRSSDKYGTAVEVVGPKKRQVISQVSDYFRVCFKQYLNLEVRYDVIAIQKDKLYWIKNAFPYCGKGF
jgi:putative endonuclease